MRRNDLTYETIAPLAATLFPAAPVVRLVPLRGGLESSVAQLTLRESERRTRQIVLKRLRADDAREAARYRLLATSGVTPACLGSIEDGEHTYLFLEHVRQAGSWPWGDSTNTRRVLEQLARVHRIAPDAAHEDAWDYEKELADSAAATEFVATDVAPFLSELDVRGELRALRRVAATLGAKRREMNATLGTALLHGDVHTANVVLRGDRVVLLDWARSRVGSPLEDVSSWLLSLRSWEPAAARDHDSLFRFYLSAAGHAPIVTPSIRDAYWTAAASNVLAGALRYQLLVAREKSGRTRARAVAHAHAAFRVIRRADERLRRHQ